MKKNLIASVYSGHDSSFAVFDPDIDEFLIHAELERHIREKEVVGDSIEYMMILFDRCHEIGTLSLPPPTHLLNQESLKKLVEICGDVPMFVVGHHECHAANAFFTSNLDDSLVVTTDAGGIGADGIETATTAWYGNGDDLDLLGKCSPTSINIGGLWTRATRYIFKLQSGWPHGNQAGSVMAMAALGDPEKYVRDFRRMLGDHLLFASVKPHDQKPGPSIPDRDPIHPYLNHWRKIAEQNEQEMYDMAAGLQKATEERLFDFVWTFIDQCNERFGVKPKNLCISGGVSLNSVAIGKMYDEFGFENIHVPATPHDGGLTIGAIQCIHHMKNRAQRNKNFHTPYLGNYYNDDNVRGSIHMLIPKSSCFIKENTTLDDIVDLLDNQDIVAVFNGRAESGRRALGNRSILADPRNISMKDKINEKVKHRQWYRPFAPSILREKVGEWFEKDISSPYMSHVVKFKEEQAKKVPAVVHFDGTARLQTVSKETNLWYYELLTKWNEKTSVPILLNTSFNDREPICETPEHSIKCFLGTDIDHLYFVEQNILISKNQNI